MFFSSSLILSEVYLQDLFWPPKTVAPATGEAGEAFPSSRDALQRTFCPLRHGKGLDPTELRLSMKYWLFNRDSYNGIL